MRGCLCEKGLPAFPRSFLALPNAFVAVAKSQWLINGRDIAAGREADVICSASLKSGSVVKHVPPFLRHR